MINMIIFQCLFIIQITLSVEVELTLRHTEALQYLPMQDYKKHSVLFLIVNLSDMPLLFWRTDLGKLVHE